MCKRGRERRERGGSMGKQGEKWGDRETKGTQGNGGDRRDFCVTGKVQEKERKIMFPVFRIMPCSQCE